MTEPFLKMQMFKTVATPSLIYGCEVRVLREKRKSKIQATEMSILSKIAVVTRLDHVSWRKGGETARGAK